MTRLLALLLVLLPSAALAGSYGGYSYSSSYVPGYSFYSAGYYGGTYYPSGFYKAPEKVQALLIQYPVYVPTYAATLGAAYVQPVQQQVTQTTTYAQQALQYQYPAAAVQQQAVQKSYAHDASCEAKVSALEQKFEAYLRGFALGQQAAGQAHANGYPAPQVQPRYETPAPQPQPQQPPKTMPKEPENGQAAAEWKSRLQTTVNSKCVSCHQGETTRKDGSKFSLDLRDLDRVPVVMRKRAALEAHAGTMPQLRIDNPTQEDYEKNRLKPELVGDFVAWWKEGEQLQARR